MKCRLARTDFLVLLLAIGMVSCGDGRVVEYKSVAAAEWERSDAKEFIVTFPQAGTYETSLLLRTTTDYPYMDLAVVVDETILPSRMHRVDTVTCHVFDSLGRERGSGVSIYQHTIALHSGHFATSDTLQVRVRPAMRRLVLPGVADVGIALSKKSLVSVGVDPEEYK